MAQSLSPSRFDTRRREELAEIIRIRGLVQGVGFRPTVWRLAHRFGLRGSVANDAEGVRIHVCGPAFAIERFVHALKAEAPALARVDAIERNAGTMLAQDARFVIAASGAGGVRTGVVPDAAACAECVQEVFTPGRRRYRYPFANCTHCGPRLSIIESIPYDRATTTMRHFAMCEACAAEYNDPHDRRFHAQPIACPACGPRAVLEGSDHAPVAVTTLAATMLTARDAVDAAAMLLQRGHIVAIKGLGGFQLACDAGNEDAVARLRAAKHRERKPFALMARDLEVVRRWCSVSDTEATLLQGTAAPIVIMAATGRERVAAGVAPGLATLGLMLPNTPLHHLLLQGMRRPIVLTSGNLVDEPQCIDNTEAKQRLAGVAEYFLMHDRGIARRVDDSVVRVTGAVARVMRGARGYAPLAMALPAGFDRAPQVLAMGTQLKSTFCLVRHGQALMSPHIGDLDDARTFADFEKAIADYTHLFQSAPEAIAVDMHPDYQATKFGRALAQRQSIALVPVQHHHAHAAACMAENDWPLDAGPVLGVTLDGLGFGADASLWGGEFLRADYLQCTRVGTFKPVALPGGEQAMREPWRNTYAHLVASIGWAAFAKEHANLELFAYLHAKPRRALDSMMAAGVNSPPASSCGRLFDAVAAAVGVCRSIAYYEGQAAIEFEALVDERTLREEGDDFGYPFIITDGGPAELPMIEPLPMWRALLHDLEHATPVPVIAARFHNGLAIAIVSMIAQLNRDVAAGERLHTVALSGGVFQNRVLHAQVEARLAAMGLRVLTHRQVPANDGGVALGQAVVAAAQRIAH